MNLSNLKPADPAVAESELNVATATSSLTFDLNQSANATIKLIAWLDGPTTKDADAGKVVQFSFSFVASAVPAAQG